VGAWPTRRVAGGIPPRLVVAGRSTPLTSRLGQLQLLRLSPWSFAPCAPLSLAAAVTLLRGLSRTSCCCLGRTSRCLLGRVSALRPVVLGRLRLVRPAL
jgi:hypothetical protein